uniref:Protective antigen MAA2 n=1 Tax=Metamycoplasma arthritidis TaxID=2111 RepID=O30923_METAT|nr:protective antigen MAA2 [Metamycoplasma arthritidis]
MKKSRKALSLLLAGVLGTTLFATSVVAAACDNEEKPTPEQDAQKALEAENNKVQLDVEGKDKKEAKTVKPQDVKHSGYDNSKYVLTVDKVEAKGTSLKVTYTLKSKDGAVSKAFEKTIDGFKAEAPAQDAQKALEAENNKVQLDVEGKDKKEAKTVKPQDVKHSGYDNSKYVLTVDKVEAKGTSLKVTYTLKSKDGAVSKAFEKTIDGFKAEAPAQDAQKALEAENNKVQLDVEGKDKKEAKTVKPQDVKHSGYDNSKYVLTVDKVEAKGTSLKVTYTLKSKDGAVSKAFEKTIDGFKAEAPAQDAQKALEAENNKVQLDVEGKDKKEAKTVKPQDVKHSGYDNSKYVLTVDKVEAKGTSLKVTYTLKSKDGAVSKAFEKTIDGFKAEAPAQDAQKALEAENNKVQLDVEGKDKKEAKTVKPQDVKHSGYDNSKYVLTVDKVEAKGTSLKVTYTLKSKDGAVSKAFEKTIDGFKAEA